MDEKLLDEIKDRLISCNNALEYAAFNYNGMKLIDLSDNTIESTCPAEQALIQVRENNELLKQLIDTEWDGLTGTNLDEPIEFNK